MSEGEGPSPSRRRAANRANAALSTGPVSAAGRRASSRNALKHGLSVMPTGAEARVSALAALLVAARGGDPSREEAASRLAEALLDVVRVREARHQALLLAGRPDAMPPAVLDRYEKRALSRRRRLLRAFEA